MNRFINGESLIVLACIVVFWPALRGEFIFDDDIHLTQNHLVQAPDGLSRIWGGKETAVYWPVTYSNFWLEWRLWGMKTSGYHITNLLLHMATALLLWSVLRELNIPGAWFAAMLFAVHPINVESVAWISQRKGLLALLFSLLSISWYLKVEEGRGKAEEEKSKGGEEQIPSIAGPSVWYWLSVAAFLLAMLSKGSVAILPVVLLMIVWWRRPIIKIDVARTLPYWLIAIVFTGVNVWQHTTGKVIRTASFGERLAGAGAVVWFYLGKALAPIQLVFVYPQWHVEPRDLLWWLPLATVAAVTLVLLAKRNAAHDNWGRALLFAWLFFCVALVPVLGFVDAGYMKYSPVADHYQHIALIGVVALVAAAWGKWRQHASEGNRTGCDIAAFIMISVCGFLSWQQSRIYRDPIALYQDTLAKNPACSLAEYNLGNTFADKGKLTEAIEHYQRALQIQPNSTDAHNNLGNTLLRQGQIEEAITHYREALRIEPTSAVANTNLGIALLTAERIPEAIGYLNEAVRFDADHADAHYNLGIALAKSGRLEEAIGEFKETLRVEPYNLRSYTSLTTAYAQLQRPAEAITYAEQGLQIARAQGNAEAAQQIEDWLKTYRAAGAKLQGGSLEKSNSKPAQ